MVTESHPDIGTVGYQYSLNGSRTRRTSSAGIDYYGVDAHNKLAWVNRGVNAAPTGGQTNPYTLFQYDANGRMTRRERKYAVGGTIQTYDYFWDGDDRLRQVKQGISTRFTATYDGDGLRASRTDLFSATANYTWGPGGVLHDGSTTYTPGLSQRFNGLNPRFVHSDWIGSTRYLSDSSGNFFPSALRYDAFGQRTALAGPNYPTPFQFAGGWGYETEYSDASEPYLGLRYLEQRYYDPATGRFISPDPIGLDGGLNLYAYVENDPVNAVDPSGLIFDTIWDVGVLLVDVGTLAYDVVTGALGHVVTLDVTALGMDAGAAVIPFFPGGAGAGLRLVGGGAHVAGGAAAAARAARATGHAARGSAMAARACSQGGNGGRGGGPDHAQVQRDIQNTAGGRKESEIRGSRRIADVEDAKGRIHQIGDMRSRGGLRPSARERAAIEDIRKAVGRRRTIIFHDKMGKKPTLINPDLRPNWKPAPSKLRKNP